MKKKIAIVLDSAIIGGVEIALTQMLRNIDMDRYEISLFTNVKSNLSVSMVPACIKIYDLDNLDLRMHFIQAIKSGKFCRAAQMLYCYVKLRFSKTEFEKIKWSIDPFMLSDEVFDCAIAYKQSWKSVFLALDRIKAKKSVVWIHGIFWGSDQMKNETLKIIERADKLFCVSASTKKYIEEVLPSLVDRTEVLYNLVDSREIETKAKEELYLGDEITLVTVGRLSSEKGQDMIPQTMRYLLDAGYKVKWYVVGDGALRGIIEQKCRELNVEKDVILTGKKSNPYPYINNCDFYVQTSYTEGFCTTTIEAKVLLKVIVTTDAPGMREQLISGKNGLIVDNMTPESLFEGIKTVIDNPALCEKFVAELRKETYDNRCELQKLYTFIES